MTRARVPSHLLPPFRPATPGPDLAALADPARPANRRGAAAILDAALRSTRLADRFRDGDLTQAQRDRLAHVITDRAKAAARAITASLADGDITLASWQAHLRDGILAAHQAAAQARAGRRKLDDVERAKLAELSRRQLEFLRRFVADVRSGQLPLDGTTAHARAELYGAAVWSVAQGVAMAKAKAAGLDQARSELGASDHCRECLSQAAKGWQPIDVVVPIGARICRANCRCSITYRISRGRFP